MNIFENLMLNFFEGDDLSLEKMCDYLKENCTSSPSDKYLLEMREMFKRLRENPVCRLNSSKLFKDKK